MSYTNGLDKPSDYFETTTYTGTGSSLSISSLDFSPDLVWIKSRSGATEHVLTDSVRGVTKELSSNDNGAEETVAQGLTAFNSDGFTLGTDGSYNTSSATYAGWSWKAGGSASSNSNGSITSTVSANTTSGFSVVSWTGNGSTATIGHGLGLAPKVVIIKSRDNAHAWFVGHESLGWTKYMTLENSNAINDDVIWNDTDPTSNVFSVGSYSSTNGSGVKFIGYCFAEKKGYSKFGSYTGNGNADGTFIYLGFSPAFFILKRTDATEQWLIKDNKRPGYNPNNTLYANLTNAEDTSSSVYGDFVSNGVKLRGTYNGMNASGGTYIYMAFAESPFVTSTGIPTTAR